jgi:hypothetical protein
MCPTKGFDAAEESEGTGGDLPQRFHSNDVPMLVLSNSTCFRGILALVSLRMVHVGAYQFHVYFLYGSL